MCPGHWGCFHVVTITDGTAVCQPSRAAKGLSVCITLHIIDLEEEWLHPTQYCDLNVSLKLEYRKLSPQLGDAGR